MTRSAAVKRVAIILRKRFPNITLEESIHIAWLIVEDLDEIVSRESKDE